MNLRPSDRFYAVLAVIVGALSSLTCLCSAQVPAAPASPVLSWQKHADGLTLRTAAGPVQVQVWSPDVIRIHSGPAARSLAVIAAPTPTSWHLNSDAKSVSVVTGRIQARVDRRTGAVRFLDAKGGVLLAEEDGGRHVTAGAVRRTAGTDAGPAFQVVQGFTLSSDEDLYGLGQHQSGDMSYRGKSVTLLQQNREVAVPFLVSSRGYGLLWDNPSVTQVDVGAGNASPIPAAQFADEDGSSGGLTAHYYKGENFDTVAASQKDTNVDFDWSQAPPAGLPHDHYSVRWTGFLLAKQAGDYTLTTTADDGVRLWVDDKPVIDDWQAAAARSDSATFHFAAGSRHRIRLDYFQNLFAASIRLSWSLPTEHPLLRWSSEAGRGVDYYFVYGPALDRVIAGYRALTGGVPLPPKWALGFWQSKERYESQQELLDVVNRYRADKIPLDVVVQDWQYWSPHPWGSHEFDAKRYPDPTAMMRDLHAQNAHLVISVWAKFDQGSANHDELEKGGALYTQTIPYVFPPGKGQWYDPFSPNARRLYWDEISRELFATGIDGWWLDASEPELSGSWGEFRGYDTAAGPGAEVYNAYPLEHTRAVYEGQRAESGAKRVMTLTRSAYAGQQRNGAATWSGDITASWNVFAAQIPAGLNFCLSGIPYWTTDIGGFFVPGGQFPGGSSNPEYRELFTRWFEYGAFCPLFRVHGTDTPKELWRFGPDTEKTLVKCDTLRYRLMPYIYSQAWQVTHNSGTLMRALVMDFPGDRVARENKDEFLFGPSFLVCPVTKPDAVTRPVYLPAGTHWVDFWTGKTSPGGRTIIAPAPIGTIPLYVRAGSIVPMGPVIQYATEESADPMELRIYPGADGAFTLYEDQGDGYGYEKGANATIPLRWDNTTHTLSLGTRSGDFSGMVARRVFRLVLVRPGVGSDIDAATTGTRTVSYDGHAVAFKLGR